MERSSVVAYVDHSGVVLIVADERPGWSVRDATFGPVWSAER